MQYVYRFDPILKVCHFHKTEIPSERGRSWGYGLLLALAFIAVVLVFFSILFPRFFFALPFCVYFLMKVAIWYFYHSEPSLWEAEQITHQLYGPVSKNFE